MKKRSRLLAIPVVLVGTSIALSQTLIYTMTTATSSTNRIEDPAPLKDSFKGKFRIGVAVSTGILRGQETEQSSWFGNTSTQLPRRTR